MYNRRESPGTSLTSDYYCQPEYKKRINTQRVIRLIKMGGKVSNRILYLLLYLINSVVYCIAHGQTVTMEDGIPAIRNTTTAVIIKKDHIVQTTHGFIDKELSKKPNRYYCIKYFC